MRHLLPAAILALAGLFAPALADDDDTRTDGELQRIAEEQALLRRQLQRLHQTMQVLSGTLEAEGRPRAVELLAEGLLLLEDRDQGAGSLTIEELMEQARTRAEGGQVVGALELQEDVIGKLDRLLAILMDRQNLESLEENLEEIAALKRDLSGLRVAEVDLREDTETLEEDVRDEESRDLLDALSDAVARQDELLEQNEEIGRETGLHELEAYEAELEALLQQQRADATALAAWRPQDSESLEQASRALDAARSATARAERLERAAEELRAAAEPDQTGSEAAQELDAAARREERHEQAAGDPAAAASAEALREGAQAARDAGDAPLARPRLEELAAGLEEAARFEREAAEAARAETSAQLEPAARGEGAAAEAAREAREELETARSAVSPQDADDDAQAEAQRATEQAARTLSRGREDLLFAGRQLADSQERQREGAERVARGLATLPGAEEEGPAEAREEIDAAVEAMAEAARAARAGDPSAGAEAARAAEDALERALSALRGARETAGQEAQGELSRLAEEQRQIAAEAEQLGERTEQAGVSEEASARTRAALESAREAAERAAAELSEGRSATAAASQREAQSALREAAREASAGAQPQTQEERERADALAERQQEIEKELLDLRRRIEERRREESSAMRRAESGAQRAQQSLSDGDLSEAQQEEREVEQAIDEAMEELQEEEEQYQRLRDEELLFRIAEEVSELRDGHVEQMQATREIDGQREPGERPSRAQKLRLRRVAREEGALGVRAADVARAIEEEGSLVFAEILRQAETSLGRLAIDLDDEGGWQTGPRVQALQEEVERDLDWLLEALQDEQRRREREANQEEEQQDGEQQPEDSGENRLVPDEAELKLLRRMEVEIQGQVELLLALYPELASDDVDPLLLEDVTRIAHRHERLAGLFARFRARLGLPDPAPTTDAGGSDR